MTIEQRLEILENGLSRIRRFNWVLLITVMMVFMLLVFVLLVVAISAVISSREDVVNARQFNLLDEDGKTRACLAVESDFATLTMSDEDEKPRVFVRASKEGAGFGFFNENGKPHSGLMETQDGGGLSLSDENGKRRFSLTASKEGTNFSIYDENTTCAFLTVSKEGTSLGLSNAKGKTSATLSLLENSSWLHLTETDAIGKSVAGIGMTNHELSLALTDANRSGVGIGVVPYGALMALYDHNSPRAALSLNTYGPSLELRDKKGQTRASFGANIINTPDANVVGYDESSILLLDPNGQIIWEAPR